MQFIAGTSAFNSWCLMERAGWQLFGMYKLPAKTRAAGAIALLPPLWLLSWLFECSFFVIIENVLIVPAIQAALLLFLFSVLREEFASLFQTFSRNDLPGEAALARGRYVFQKK